ncbi:MAG: hypothetical protein O3C40_30830 [Planctomycetota bacterium]|nr:hypothetical protein [Planctomycetota bacterium]
MAKRPTTIRELVNSWTRKSGDHLNLHAKLELLGILNDELYAQYQPFAVKPDYMDRLFAWIDGASSVRDKKLMFELASWLLFVGEAEMKSLYQSSFAGVITRWVIDQANIDITCIDAPDRIAQALKRTFVGSMAGMEIGTYCRVNGIEGQSLRPDFRDHAHIGTPDSLRMYLNAKGYARIVAVEDYVCTGQQMEEACAYLSKLTEFPTLLCPMLVAREGVETGNELARKHSHFDFNPLFAPPLEIAVPKAPLSSSNEPTFIVQLRELISRLWTQVHGTDVTQHLYGPFGCGGTGSLLLTYLNCPDNVPPIIHHKSDSWEPLFQRSSREG